MGGRTPDFELPSLDLLLPGETCCFSRNTKRSLAESENPGKDVPGFRFQHPRRRDSDRAGDPQFEVELEAGLRLSKITGLADDLAIALRVPSVRIVAPLPGKNTVGIEVPNNERQIVRLREVMEEARQSRKKCAFPLYLGKDVAGKPLVVDLATLPHC